ncbi:MAG TPA: DUF4198 domain-containing protein [Thermoanaerobaculia bacterium]
MKKLIPTFAFLAAAPLLAHDFWIEPTSFHPEVGTVVGIALRVGQDFRGDPVPRMTESIEKFVVVSRSGDKPVDGVSGRDPAGIVRVAEPGYLLVGYRSLPKRIDLPAEKFERYLKEEGLEAVIATRAARGDSQKSSKEIYSRCAKAIIDAEGGGASGYDRALGFRLELVPEKAPKEVVGGRSMPVRLVFEGKPLAGALVVVMNRDEPKKRLSARTDTSGRVAFDLSGGVWLVKSVHMVAAPRPSGADWESLWASLTFEVP